MGDLFENTIGSKRWPIVVIIAVVATLYTAYGGLLISIITDQWQVRTRPRCHQDGTTPSAAHWKSIVWEDSARNMGHA